MSLSKVALERNQKILLDIAIKPGNDVCADCKARGPRWTSHNLGIFICVNCASTHRKIGTHISKVKSITMDSWTREQIEVMKTIGNVNSNTKYIPNEARHPPPTNLMDGERDSEMEQYIRDKYERKRFMRDAAPKPAPSALRPPSAPVASPRSVTTPLNTSTQPMSYNSRPAPPPLPSSSRPAPPVAHTPSQSAPYTAPAPAPAVQFSQPAATTVPQQSGSTGVWADLIALQTPAANTSLPLQYQQPPVQSMPMMQQPQMTPYLMQNQFGAPGPSSNGFHPPPALQLTGASPMQIQYGFQQPSSAAAFTPSSGMFFQQPSALPSGSFYQPQQPQPQQYPIQAPTAQLPGAYNGMMYSSPSPLLSTTPQGGYGTTPSPQPGMFQPQSAVMNPSFMGQQVPQPMYSPSGMAWQQPPMQQPPMGGYPNQWGTM